MIDASRSPRAAWKRYVTFVLLLVLIVAAGYLIWTKELHHTASGPSPSRTLAAAAPIRTTHAVSTVTTIRRGLPVGSRDSFGG